MYPSPNKSPMKTIGKRKRRNRVGAYVSKKYKTGTVKMNPRFQLGKSSNMIPLKFRMKKMVKQTSAYKGGSMSGGFIRLPKRNSKRTNLVAQYQKTGCVQTNEVSGTVTVNLDVQTAYFGHITCPINQMNFIFVQAFLKKIWADLGVPIKNPQEIILPLTVGDQIIFTWQSKQEPVIVTILTFPFVALDTLAIQAARLVTALFSPLNNYSTYSFIGLRFAPQSTSSFPFKRWDPDRIRVKFACKSSFKLQNVSSYSATDDEADNVANIPLYGKTYSGNNTGVQFSGSNIGTGLFNYTFTGNVGNGIVNSQPTNTSDFDFLKEPINVRTLGRNIIGGKVKVDPGHLVTNVMNWQKSYSFTNYMSLIYGQTVNNDLAPFVRMGKFCFYGLEKMINLGPLSGGNMKFFYEINLQSMASCTIGKNTYTGQNFSNQIVNFP